MVPPEALNVREYPTPGVPGGRGEAVVIERGPTTSSTKLFCAVSAGELLSVTRIVKFEEPAAVSVPLRMPPPVNVRPAGNDPVAMDHE